MHLIKVELMQYFRPECNFLIINTYIALNLILNHIKILKVAIKIYIRHYFVLFDESLKFLNNSASQ